MLPSWEAPTPAERAAGAEPPASFPTLSARLRTAVLSAQRRVPGPTRVSERDWLRAAKRVWAAVAESPGLREYGEVMQHRALGGGGGGGGSGGGGAAPT